MKYDFDQITERRGTGCIKWDKTPEGREDMLPMWIADMDFPAAPGILTALQTRLSGGVFGYGLLTDAYYRAVEGWMERRHHCKVERDWIVFNAGVVSALNYAVQTLTEPGDEILVPSPVYGPFYRSVEDWGRVLVKSPLQEENLRYTFDFEDLERRITPKTKVFMLCSPHNPVGRVWDRAELKAVAEFCLRHKLAVIADEIHSDLVFQPHTCFLNLSPELNQYTILCTAPSKTFNLAGLQASNIIIPNGDLRARYEVNAAKTHANAPNAFSEAAVIGAYDHAEDWLDELLVYLEGNVDLFCETVTRDLPKLRVRKPEGTYMTWLDCSGLGLSAEVRTERLLKNCGLYLNDGAIFGQEGRDFVRINLACPRAYVTQCLERLKCLCEPLGKV